MASTLWKSERLIFRGVDPEDDDFLERITADPDAFLNTAPLIPTPRNKQQVKFHREWLTSDTMLMAAVICLPAATDETDNAPQADNTPSKPTPIGIISLASEDVRFIHHRRCVIGINILREHQRQGYGSEAIRWALRWGFKRANLHRMGIGAFAWNVGAVKLYERLGFKHEARRREFLFHDGEWHDLVELAILDREWKELYDGPSKGE